MRFSGNHNALSLLGPVIKCLIVFFFLSISFHQVSCFFHCNKLFTWVMHGYKFLLSPGICVFCFDASCSVLAYKGAVHLQHGSLDPTCM